MVAVLYTEQLNSLVQFMTKRKFLGLDNKGRDDTHKQTHTKREREREREREIKNTQCRWWFTEL